MNHTTLILCSKPCSGTLLHAQWQLNNVWCFQDTTGFGHPTILFGPHVLWLSFAPSAPATVTSPYLEQVRLVTTLGPLSRWCLFMNSPWFSIVDFSPFVSLCSDVIVFWWVLPKTLLKFILLTLPALPIPLTLLILSYQIRKH